MVILKSLHYKRLLVRMPSGWILLFLPHCLFPLTWMTKRLRCKQRFHSIIRQIYSQVYGKRQTANVKRFFSKKKHKRKGFHGLFFSLYTLKFAHLNQKAVWTPISLSWFSWFDEIVMPFKKKIKLHRGFVKDHTQGGKINTTNHAAQWVRGAGYTATPQSQLQGSW